MYAVYLLSVTYSILHCKNTFVSALWFTNYVMETLFIHNLKHIFRISVLEFLVTY